MPTAFLLALSLTVAYPDPEPTPKKLTVHATTNNWRFFAGGEKTPFTRVITTPGELAIALGKPVSKEKETLEQAARALKVKSIDLSKQMILVLVGKTERTGGYSVEVSPLMPKGGALKVSWKVKGPPADSFVTMALTTPGTVLLVDRFSGKVTFDPTLTAPKNPAPPKDR